MASTTDQLVRFTTDSVGLERTFRFLQALFQIIASYPALFGLFLTALNFTTATSHAPAATLSILLALRQRMNLARRFFRLFRFIESFNAAQKLYLSLSSSTQAGEKKAAPEPKLEAWLDVFARTFNGMYLLLDAPAIVSEMRIEGLQLWSPEFDRVVMVEAQRFWLFALACGALSSFLKMQRVRRERRTVVVDAADEKKSNAVTKAEKEEAVRAGERVRTKEIRGFARSTAANSLDIILPGVIVGWIDASPGTVGLAMLVTTVLTGMDAWERCGREVGR
ncbi:AoPex11B [Coniochaeta sp. 2T2.1]|nr:AoPex11B [Coniochaeta sp. 2T2.1]